MSARSHPSARTAVCFLALALGVPAALPAAETASFLKISPGARPIGMGNAFTAVADDLNALVWNPAGLVRMRRREASFMHAELYADTRYDFIGYAHPFSGGASPATAALSITRLTSGAIEGRDKSRRNTGSFHAADTALSLAYSRRLPGGGPQVGATLKLLESSIAGVSARGAALDLGLQHPFRAAGTKVRLGAAVLNLGPGLRFLDETNALPLTLSAGAGVRLRSSVLLAVDYRYRPHSGKTQMGFGTEFTAFPALTLRAGYAHLIGQTAAFGGTAGRPLAGIGMGLGLRLGKAHLDYAFTPAGQLGNGQRFSLTTRF